MRVVGRLLLQHPPKLREQVLKAEVEVGEDEGGLQLAEVHRDEFVLGLGVLVEVGRQFDPVVQGLAVDEVPDCVAGIVDIHPVVAACRPVDVTGQQLEAPEAAALRLMHTSHGVEELLLVEGANRVAHWPLGLAVEGEADDLLQQLSVAKLQGMAVARFWCAVEE